MALVCHNFNIPFLNIRAISDIVHEQESFKFYETFFEKVSKHAADLVLLVLYDLHRPNA